MRVLDRNRASQPGVEPGARARGREGGVWRTGGAPMYFPASSNGEVRYLASGAHTLGTHSFTSSSRFQLNVSAFYGIGGARGGCLGGVYEVSGVVRAC